MRDDELHDILSKLGVSGPVRVDLGTGEVIRVGRPEAPTGIFIDILTGEVLRGADSETGDSERHDFAESQCTPRCQRGSSEEEFHAGSVGYVGADAPAGSLIAEAAGARKKAAEWIIAGFGIAIAALLFGAIAFALFGIHGIRPNGEGAKGKAASNSAGALAKPVAPGNGESPAGHALSVDSISAAAQSFLSWSSRPSLAFAATRRPPSLSPADEDRFLEDLLARKGPNELLNLEEVAAEYDRRLGEPADALAIVRLLLRQREFCDSLDFIDEDRLLSQVVDPLRDPAPHYAAIKRAYEERVHHPVSPLTVGLILERQPQRGAPVTFAHEHELLEAALREAMSFDAFVEDLRRRYEAASGMPATTAFARRLIFRHMLAKAPKSLE